MQNSQPTTLDLYTHAFDENKKAASEKLQTGPESLTKFSEENSSFSQQHSLTG
jgi:hypothetical protein